LNCEVNLKRAGGADRTTCGVDVHRQPLPDLCADALASRNPLHCSNQSRIVLRY